MTGSIITLSTITLLCGLLAAETAFADDIAAGRDKSRACAMCHGKLGLAQVPNAPNLAGENKRYLISQLNAFRSGDRNHSQMTLVAKGLSDKDIADLAAWFAAIKVTATAPDID